jgi:outer membrane protein, heavy metal efflux system
MFCARILVFALSVAALYGQQGSADRLSLADLITQALGSNPEVLAAQKRYEANLQRPRAESALPDPMVGVGYNSMGAPLPGWGLGSEMLSNIGIMFTQELPYPGKRAIRAQVATKEAEAEWQAYLGARLTVVSRVKQAYFRVQHAHQMLAVIANNRQVLERMLKVAESRYSVGQGMQQDIIGTQTRLSILEAQRVQYRAMLASAEAALNTSVNRPSRTPVAAPPEPAVHETLPPFEDLLAQARLSAPMVAREQRMIERAEAGLRLARRDWYPDMALNGGYYTMGRLGNMYMFRADVRLPVWGTRQRAAITESVATIAETRRTYEATQLTLEASLREEYVMAESARRLMELYAGTVIPQANLTLESALLSYQSGSATFIEPLQNFMTAVEYEMNYHEQMLNFHLALARMEEMTGVNLVAQGDHQ